MECNSKLITTQTKPNVINKIQTLKFYVKTRLIKRNIFLIFNTSFLNYPSNNDFISYIEILLIIVP